MKITFDKVEVLCIGKYQTEAERRLSLPLNHHLEIGKITQVGHTVENFKEGDDILFLTVSKNPIKGDKAYIREREILFKLVTEEGKKDVLETTGDDVCVKVIKEEEFSGLIYTPAGSSTGSLTKAEVIWINPNNNELNLEIGDIVHFKQRAGERVLQYNDNVLLHANQVIYTDE